MDSPRWLLAAAAAARGLGPGDQGTPQLLPPGAPSIQREGAAWGFAGGSGEAAEKADSTLGQETGTSASDSYGGSYPECSSVALSAFLQRISSLPITESRLWGMATERSSHPHSGVLQHKSQTMGEKGSGVHL
ncbi:hypothetical protein DR999_PMT13193 [Platysternon megacephalum]|uniref:Uncharacterized protein n=1 Tax=Platysternon megacephalum TaxID=55544 RepID=A0A4D9E6W4_9SAUR|nr:hypothetical protein DR999_PMT13193 [Platysternon megacephalum]